MTVAYRQPIRPGDVGRDVTAVKRAMRKMGVRGSGAMNNSNRAGPAFVTCLHNLERSAHLAIDNVYGPKTHAIVAKHFDAYGAMLYRTAKLRHPPIPPVPGGSAQENAKKLLAYAQQGKYQATNPGDLRDITATAAGKAVWSQGGYYVHIDHRVMEVLVWLIEQGHKIGTYAICSDHHNDGPHGHSGGLAVDIEWIDGVHVGSGYARSETLGVAQKLHTAPGELRPRQLICDGYGYIHDSTISALAIPSAAFYGYSTMAGHRNHIHCGY